MKAAIFTGTRAEYGLLRWIIKELQGSNDVCVIAGGSHLSSSDGYTIEEINKDGIKNVLPLPFLRASRTASALTRSVGNGLIRMARILETVKPDLLIVLGDRYELLIPTAASTLFAIPIVHLSGGERTGGVIDDQIRHAITKMSHIHMPSTEAHAANISRMGEEDWRIHIVGAPGLDNIRKMKLYSTRQILKLTGIDLGRPTLLCTYHPLTLQSEEDSSQQMGDLLKALSKYDLQIVFTRPNADVGSDKTTKMIKSFVRKKKGTYFFDSLGTKLYLSCMKYAKAVVGNSSSGVLEAPSFHLPTVNVGNRQQGRPQPRNVIQTGCSPREIKRGIAKALTDKTFLRQIRNTENPYGDGKASKYVARALKKIAMIPKERLLQKDLDFAEKENEWHRYF